MASEKLLSKLNYSVLFPMRKGCLATAFMPLMCWKRSTGGVKRGDLLWWVKGEMLVDLFSAMVFCGKLPKYLKWSRTTLITKENNEWTQSDISHWRPNCIASLLRGAHLETGWGLQDSRPSQGFHYCIKLGPWLQYGANAPAVVHVVNMWFKTSYTTLPDTDLDKWSKYLELTGSIKNLFPWVQRSDGLGLVVQEESGIHQISRYWSSLVRTKLGGKFLATTLRFRQALLEPHQV